eukprot:SM000077S21561  [mRNA]  locus=s77:268629:269282:- [translate_table: standard]
MAAAAAAASQANEGGLAGASSAALRQRQLERLHSMPALSVPSSEMSQLSPAAAYSPASAAGSMHGMQSPHVNAVCSMGGTPPAYCAGMGASPGAAGSKASMMEELLSSLQQLDVCGAGPPPQWLQQAHAHASCAQQVGPAPSELFCGTADQQRRLLPTALTLRWLLSSSS